MKDINFYPSVNTLYSCRCIEACGLFRLLVLSSALEVTNDKSSTSTAMQPSLIRRQLGGLVPPKVASPTLLVSISRSVKCRKFDQACSQTTGTGSSLAPLVNFYSKLPKGPRPASASGGIKGRFFNGKNASGAPLVWLIGGLFGLGYTIDYQSESPYRLCG